MSRYPQFPQGGIIQPASGLELTCDGIAAFLGHGVPSAGFVESRDVQTTADAGWAMKAPGQLRGTLRPVGLLRGAGSRVDGSLSTSAALGEEVQCGRVCGLLGEGVRGAEDSEPGSPSALRARVKRRTLTGASLSTMWSTGKAQTMAEFVAEAREFGFAQLELNAAITPDKLRELETIGGLSVSSIHAPCPNVLTSRGTLASTLSVASLDEDERLEAVACTRETIELASEVGARVVIVHAGQVEFERVLTDKLYELYGDGRLASREHEETERRLGLARHFWACAHLDAARQSLRELADLASGKGVILGLENRLHPYEIPSLEEMDQLLDEFPEMAMGYWHDVGHAEVQDRLGLTSHADWFKRLGHRIVGVHLHDVRGIRDHYAPGSGELDWNLIAAQLPGKALRVCEIGQWNTREDARQAVPFLEGRGILS